MAGVVQSLLDRLLDDEPEQAVEPPEPEARALLRYKLGVRRDLEALLNSRRPQLRALDGRGPFDGTVIAFGLADLSTEDFATAGVRERVRRMVAQCIRDHEPRLSEVEVEVDGAPTSRGVRFRITAVLTVARTREAVAYAADVRPSDRAIAIELQE